MVERGADADGEGDYGGGETEGDLSKWKKDVNPSLFFWEATNLGETGREGKKGGGGKACVSIPSPQDYPIPVPSYCSSSSIAPQCRP